MTTRRRRPAKAVATKATRSPVVPRTALAQTESRALVEAALRPWLVTRWEQHDYGIDAVVEIISPVLGSSDHDPSGKLFSIQLKATDAADPPASIEVTTGHLQYWLRHSMPVLLVSVHIPTASLQGRWIDHSLVGALKERSPDFWAQKTVAVSLSEGMLVSGAVKRDIDRYVTRFHARATALTPNKFFDLRTRVESNADALLRAGEATRLESVRLLVERTRKKLRTSAYMVAITGPQRAGKSTFINALLRADISPVAAFPTTAVPLVFGPGETPAATITFANGTMRQVEATVEALRPFAAQQDIDPTAEHVRLVRVTLPNEALARGIEIVDTPGLHDASDVVRDVTEVALNNADAVLFVLDAGLDTKFKLSVHDINDLKRLQSKKEHLIVLLNQSDLLSPERRELVFAYVRSELAKYGLGSGLPSEPLFVSGRDAWLAHVAGKAVPAEFRVVEEGLWGHLLRNRRTGLHRLQEAVGLLQTAAEETGSLSTDRQNRGREAADIDAARETCTAAVAQARKAATRVLAEGVASFRAVLAQNGDGLRFQWKRDLDSMPKESRLPTADEARQRLVRDVEASRDMLWEAKNERLRLLAEQLNTIVRKALSDARVSLGVPPVVSIQDMYLPDLPALDLSLPEAVWGFLGGAAFFFLNPLVGLFTTLIGWGVGHDVAVANRSARIVKKLIEGYDARLAEVHKAIEQQVVERFANGANALWEQARGRLDTFIRDAQRRVERLGRALAPDEEIRLEEARATVTRVRQELGDIALELGALMYDRKPPANH